MVHVVQAEGRDARARYRLSVREPLPFDCVDGVGTPEQVGSALNLGGSAVEGDWSVIGRGNGMCLHENQLWAVHVDVDQPGDITTRTQNGPYVQRWNGVAWEDMSFPAVDPSVLPDRVAIASDGAGSVFVAFSQVYTDCDQPPGCRCPVCGTIANLRQLYGWQAIFIQVWAWDGGWSMAGEYPLGTTLGLSGDFKEHPDSCLMSFYQNVLWTHQNETEGECGGNTFGTGSVGRAYLAAQNGSHVVVWTEQGEVVEVLADNSNCIGIPPTDHCTEETTVLGVNGYAGVFSGSDGNIEWLSNDASFGISDLVWDTDSAAPLLSWSGGDVSDARDGTLIQNIPDGQTFGDGRRYGVVFSNAYGGFRYLLGTQNPLGPYVWETSPDCTMAAGPLDGADYYANGVEVMPSLSVRPLAEAQNIWQLGAIGRGCAGTGDLPCNGGPFYDDAALSSAVFTRRCVANCPPSAWYPIGPDPAGRSEETASNYTQILTSTGIYVIVRTSDVTDTFPSEHRVYRVPITRCVAECVPPSFWVQLFSSGQHYNSGQAPVGWYAFFINGPWDRVLYYVDNVLVYTDEPYSGYYGGAAPGTYDVGALAEGDHVMKVVGQIDAGGGPAGDCAELEIIDSATITIDPPIVPGTYLHVTYRVDGVEYGPYAVNIDGFGGIQVGGISGSQGIYNHLIRNVKVGTSGYGSTELFNAALTSGSIVPPFDSTTGAGDLSITGSGMLVQNADGADAYAEKALATGGDVYISFEVNFDNDEVAGPDGFSIPVVILDGSSAWIDAIYADFRSAASTHLKFLTDWGTNTNGNIDGTITDSTWFTIDLFYSTT